MSKFSREELLKPGAKKIYTGRELDQIAFPLGGIGTGMISLGGWGQLRDFEIFNRPNKGLMFDFTFFTVFAQTADGKSMTKVVQGPVGGGDFTGKVGTGIGRADGSGMPRFRSCKFTGAFPFARIDFDQNNFPLQVAMEAFNPFIPLNENDSSLPVGIFYFHLTNPGKSPVKAVLFANLENKIGHPETGGGVIEYFEGQHVRGLKMSTTKHAPDSPRYGTLSLTTPHKDLQVQTHWFRGAWFDNLMRFWDQASSGQLEENRERAEHSDKQIGNDIGSIGLKVAIQPGQTVHLPVFMTWHNPTTEHYWKRAEVKPKWTNHYAKLHADAVAVAEYVGKNEKRLEDETRTFANTLFESTLPDCVMDSVSSQISILKSPTCLRLTDGSFWGWEGCHDSAGCCEGTCTHVWNYAQAMAFLFPALERTIRNSDYAINLHDDGHMTFRMPLPLGEVPQPNFHAAADGQMGGVMKVYREWQLCGDDKWLKKLWPEVKKSLEYAWKFWDRDKDGVMEGVQHNTYDIEFYGPNTMMGSFYLGALRAGEEMARHLGFEDDAKEYRRLFESGKAKMDETLFNGEYYIQDVRPEAINQTSHDEKLAMGGQSKDPKNPGYPKYQYGIGCLSDQLIGQWLARVLHLGDLFNAKKVRTTMASIFKYNWKPELWDHANPERIYAINDESALVCATWPRGERPALPFPYADEAFCGIEYQVASHMIYEGLVDEGLSIVKGCRDRHTGVRRNPWNEFECGHHYARSLASYAVMLALADFEYSAPKQRIGFAPRVFKDKFACFFAVDSGYGLVRQEVGSKKRAEVDVRAGSLNLKEIRIGFPADRVKVTGGGKDVAATVTKFDEVVIVALQSPVLLKAGEKLTIDVA